MRLSILESIRSLVVATSSLALLACGDVDNGPCSAAWTPLLTNASFDDGHEVWTEEPASPPSICEQESVPFPVDSASFAACLGTNNSRVQTLSQVVELPAGTTRVRLSGKRCLITGETGTDVKDTAVFEVRNADTGATVAELGTWSNKDGRETCDWTSFQLEAAVTASPERALLYMHAETDDLNITSFYLDSLELEAQSCVSDS
jgi:hypothetical protein